MLSHEFHPLAAREFEEAVEHYEAMTPGKGLELARQIRAAIAQACEFPESAPVTRGSVRSIVVQPTSRWEYTVHYRAKPTFIRHHHWGQVLTLHYKPRCKVKKRPLHPGRGLLGGPVFLGRYNTGIPIARGPNPMSRTILLALCAALLLGACKPAAPPPRDKAAADPHAKIQAEMEGSVMSSGRVVIVRLRSEGKRVEVTSIFPAEIAEARVKGQTAKTIFTVNGAGDGLVLFSRDLLNGTSYRAEVKFAELEQRKGLVFPVLQPDGSLKERAFSLEQIAIPQ